MTEEKKTEITFENAFKRLELILDKMNSSQTSLDESLALFEEAEGLITFCNRKLTDAEQKVEKLVKSRTGELIVGKDGQVMTEDFRS